MMQMQPSINDELRPEHDLNALRVRKSGPGRSARTMQLDADEAALFPDSKAVNEALRFLIRITRENKPAAPEAEDAT